MRSGNPASGALRTSALSVSALVLAVGACSAFASDLERPRIGKQFGGTPIFNYSSDRGLSLGALGQLFDYGPDGQLPFVRLISAEMRYATRGARDTFVSYEESDTRGGLRSYYEASASANTYQPYYGLGDATLFDRALLDQGAYFYNHREFSVLGAVRTRMASGWDLRLGAGAAWLSSLPNAGESLYLTDFGPEARALAYPKFVFGAVLEERDFEFIASEGRYVSGSVSGSPVGFGDSQSWLRADFDYRRYDSVIPGRWLWFATQFRFAASTAGAPLTEKARIGSWGTLRGYPFGRFVSNFAASLRSEVRSLPIRWSAFGYPLKGGAGLFLDTGQIADSVPRLTKNSIRWAWGVTFFGSYFTDDFIGSADFGFTPEGRALYLCLGHAI